MKAALICSGAMRDHNLIGSLLSGAGYIAAADGGAAHARKMGILPDILVGDFDSCSPDDIRYFREKGTEIRRFPSVKDKTDTEIAADIIIEMFKKKSVSGTACPDSVLIAGALGGRYDHSLANIFLLKKFMECGIEASIIEEDNEITLIQGASEKKVRKDRFDRISILPFTGMATGVTVTNMVYGLNGALLEMPTTRGISNEFAQGAKEASVRVEKGELLVILSREKGGKPVAPL